MNLNLEHIMFAILFILAISILAAVVDWFRSKDEPLTESYSDPRIVGDDTRPPNSALIRDVYERVEM